MRPITCLSLALVCACGHEDPPPDILLRLSAVEGMSVTEMEPPTRFTGYRLFLLTYDQPADHDQPGGTRFPQRMALLHRDEAAPMVLYSTGYFINPTTGRSELTRLLDANQLLVEHRYFEPSRPQPTDWKLLTIKQAARDHHRIVSALKPLYGAKWLSSGGSKGGMTSIFHRRFFPDDVDGTVAYVSPIDFAEDQVPGPDNRYIRFLKQVGPDPACRQRLVEFQQAVLARRAEMLPLLDAVASDKSTSFDVLGREQALEYITVEMPFLFWQYGSAGDCARIPGASEKAQVIFDFLDEISDVYSYSDGDIATFLPYYHQSATQLGYPTDDESQLMLKYPGGDTARAYIPAAIPTPDYDQGAAMIDVQSWLKSAGSRVLLIYGQYDPWSAGALELGAARDSFRFYVPEGNHVTAKLMALPEDDRRVALDAVARWAATPVQEPPPKYKSVGAPRTVERDAEDSMPRYRM